MSRYYNDYLQHGWGNKPEQKAKEKAYNAEYYKKKTSTNGMTMLDLH